MKRRILIAGAGVAGPSLAFWLARAGHEVTLVERAETLRQGGQAVDFRGPVHRAVLERMGLWEALQERQTHLGSVHILDAHGEPHTELPSLMMSGELEVLRGDLCQLLFERTRDDVAYRFGDHVVALRDVGGVVEVQFAHHQAEQFDLVVGADGLHSGIRALHFADSTVRMQHHGYRAVGCTLPNLLRLERRGVIYSALERGVSLTSARSPDEMRALFVFTGDPLGDSPRDAEAARRDLRARYSDLGWQLPRLLEQVELASDLYYDDISSVQLERYRRGRVVLLGDAAYGGTLGGQGTPLAMVGAYVLAGELTAAHEDHALAFAQYERRMRPYATPCQKGATRVGGFLAPRTRLGLAARDLSYRVLASKPMERVMAKLLTQSAVGFDLPDYRDRTQVRAA